MKNSKTLLKGLIGINLAVLIPSLIYFFYMVVTNWSEFSADILLK